MPWPRGLRWRITLPFSVLIVLAVISSGFLASRVTQRQLALLVTEEGRRSAQDLAMWLEAAYNSATPRDLDTIVGQMRPAPAPTPDVVGYDRAVAKILEVPIDDVRQARRSGAVAALAAQQGLTTEMLVGQILRGEQARIEGLPMSPSQPLVAPAAPLVEAVESTRAYVREASSERVGKVAALPSQANRFSGSYVARPSAAAQDRRTLLANAKGTVLFDSAREREGSALTEDVLGRGAAIRDWQTGAMVAHVVIAAGPEAYRPLERAFLSNVSRSLALGGVLLAALALVVGWGIGQQVTRPVVAVTEAAARIADRGSHERLPVHGKDELGRMSAAFNHMADALEDQERLRRRLIADLSHELRTPISVMELDLEALGDDLQTPAEAAASLRRELGIITRLAGDLSLLSRTDRGHVELRRDVIDYGPWLAEQVRRWRPRAEAAGIELRLDDASVSRDAEIDPSRIAQALGNVLHNAIQHTPEGGTIRVSMVVGGWTGREKEVAITVVEDTGPGILPEDLPHVFKRFYRADASRERATGGHGLGLAIVQQLVALHGGEVQVESEPGSGCRVSIVLPLAG